MPNKCSPCARENHTRRASLWSLCICPEGVQTSSTIYRTAAPGSAQTRRSMAFLGCLLADLGATSATICQIRPTLVDPVDFSANFGQFVDSRLLSAQTSAHHVSLRRVSVKARQLFDNSRQDCQGQLPLARGELFDGSPSVIVGLGRGAAIMRQGIAAWRDPCATIWPHDDSRRQQPGRALRRRHRRHRSVRVG